MAVDDARQRLQRDLEEAYRRGQLDETVKSVQVRMTEISNAIKDIQTTMSTLTKSTVNRQEFEALETVVIGLDRWKWRLVGITGGVIALLQVVPLLIKLMKGSTP